MIIIVPVGLLFLFWLLAGFLILCDVIIKATRTWISGRKARWGKWAQDKRVERAKERTEREEDMVRIAAQDLERKMEKAGRTDVEGYEI